MGISLLAQCQLASISSCICTRGYIPARTGPTIRSKTARMMLTVYPCSHRANADKLGVSRGALGISLLAQGQPLQRDG